MIAFSISASIASRFAVRTGVFAEERFLGRVIDGWAQDTEEFLRTRLPHLVMVLIIAFVLGRLLRLIAARMIHLAEQHAGSPGHIAQVRTLAGVIRTTGLAIIGAIVSLQFLAAIGVNLAPLLASAGVAGIALGLAAQNIVRDMLNGVLILVEDQFNVGDQVKVAGVAGQVEAMSLRKTTVRDADGTLHIIPNSQIATVANLSNGYSIATVNVSLDFSADPDRAVELLRTIAAELRASEEFAPILVAEPQVLGVDAIRGTELIFPVVFKTMANRQFPLLREFRRRVRLALRENQLLPGDVNGLFRTVLAGAGRPPAGKPGSAGSTE
ncbi:MAG: mechanosensitive ion channel family protein [Terracidiphilus sp.]